ncbi:uncharacterized protein LOC109533299 [Dendroctonus ponderosae]|uniref:uncharacterized protein LOC109533299 n=1 Tax=Dendroctonus ponderosae TaxID=77166 RepID=UPI002035CFC5|nr:uncharacterized protein LOC109533299 [Dendroctonus ponderosae]
MWNIESSFILLLLAICFASGIIGHDNPSNQQYHIQTDEGPERYFRYQTLSGQFRKEKRLEDGTVIGTYAWIDDDGILRQRDYIADHAGYRITKSKNLYVGRNIPVGEAVKLAKKYTSSADTLISFKPRPSGVNNEYNQATQKVIPVQHSTPVPPISTAITPCASCAISPTTYKPDVAHFVSSTIGPHVEISNNALPISTSLPILSSTEAPLVDITPGGISSLLGVLSSTVRPSTTGLPLEYLKTSAQAVNDLQFPETSTDKSFSAGVKFAASPYDDLPAYNERDQNSLDYNSYVNPLNQGVFFQNGPTYPIDRNGHTYRGNKRFSQSRTGNGYDGQHTEYDGVSVTNDGFRYYIPRAYHEEETNRDNEKSGSFGYIDPFGIRRVIYYNAKPGQGFQHRKNNRYVGFDATPYDPRP